MRLLFDRKITQRHLYVISLLIGWLAATPQNNLDTMMIALIKNLCLQNVGTISIKMEIDRLASFVVR